MNRIYLFMIVWSICLTSCKHVMIESEYRLDNITILRQDWDDCMTKLTYYNNNKGCDEVGSALLYYPGRDGWFLVDNVIGEDGKIYFILCDACPKFIVNDSLHFIILHNHTNIFVDKSRWIRISSNDNFPVVLSQNREYGTTITKSIKKKKVVSSIPKWDNYSGSFFEK